MCWLVGGCTFWLTRSDCFEWTKVNGFVCLDFCGHCFCYLFLCLSLSYRAIVSCILLLFPFHFLVSSRIVITLATVFSQFLNWIRLVCLLILPRTVSNLISCKTYSLGQVENARSHFFSLGHKPDQAELQKLQAVEKHISRCTDARRGRDWKSTLREAEAATASGADASPQVKHF